MARDKDVERASDALDRIGRWLSDRLDSVVNVEINTILAHGGMTGRKMPSWPEVLCQVASEFAVFLEQRGRADLLPKDGLLTEDVFKELRKAADIALEERSSDGNSRPAADTAILYRIKRHAQILDDLITAMLGDKLGVPTAEHKSFITCKHAPAARQIGFQAPALPIEWATSLRKIWELGTNEVVFQTVLQLDGDIVNRVAPSRVSDHQMAVLREMHDGATALSFRYWRAIFDLLTALVRVRP